jgi:hypothetical protein
VLDLLRLRGALPLQLLDQRPHLGDFVTHVIRDRQRRADQHCARRHGERLRDCLHHFSSLSHLIIW